MGSRILIDSLEADKQSYEDAKTLLISAFASPELRKSSCIKKLCLLKLKDGDDPFAFISKVKMLCESVKSLEIGPDDFLTYFVWGGLNDSFRSILSQITFKNRPSIHEILDKFFIANERYNQTLKTGSKQFKGKAHSERSSNTLAVNIKADKNLRCVLCFDLADTDHEHHIYKCPNFSDPKSKIERIKTLKGCIKCGKLNHQSEECKYRFQRKCRFCSQWHFDYICLKPVKDASNKLKDKEKISSSGVAVLKSETSDTVLSTFAFKLGSHDYRALKDTGSQSSFVTERLASKFNLKTLEKNLVLTIKGFIRSIFHRF